MNRKSMALITALFMFMLSIPVAAFAGGDRPLIYKIDIKRDIDHTTQLYLSNGLSEAHRLDADGVLIHMNTYGGQVDMADSMRTAILYSRVPVYVFVDNNAASAGALISIAAKKIYMRKGANIGAATVVNQTGEAMPDKYQSYMRAMIRSTAEAHGKDTIVHGTDTLLRWVRDPAIAEAMVDDRVVIPNLIDSGKVLTFTAEEAVAWRYCDGIAESVDEVISRCLGYPSYELKSYSPSWLDNFKGFLMNPAVQSILILVIIGGIYFELQTPGVGFPSAAAVVAAVMYFAPLYIDGLAQNWEILLFIVGVLLVAVEVFVIPGFGVTGIGGIIFVITGLTLSLLDNFNFDFERVTPPDFGRATLTVLLGLGAGFVLMLWLSDRIGRRGMLRRVALAADLEASVSVVVPQGLTGCEGVAATVLRPSGKVIIGGEWYDGVSESGFIDKGSRVTVVRFENSQVYVKTLPAKPF
ncbi:MAG: nodulation protein NfeD [Tannerellaceae bacterium]|nr:nodulation protein NfeD [Tannerellaceae bacterium]